MNEADKAMVNPEDLFKIQQLSEFKSKQRTELSYLKETDNRDDLLFKYFEQLSGMHFNFEKFNQMLSNEVQSEDEMFGNMASTYDMTKV
jgi:hypothetical protein